MPTIRRTRTDGMEAVFEAAQPAQPAGYQIENATLARLRSIPLLPSEVLTNAACLVSTIGTSGVTQSTIATNVNTTPLPAPAHDRAIVPLEPLRHLLVVVDEMRNRHPLGLCPCCGLALGDTLFPWSPRSHREACSLVAVAKAVGLLDVAPSGEVPPPARDPHVSQAGEDE